MEFLLYKTKNSDVYGNVNIPKGYDKYTWKMFEKNLNYHVVSIEQMLIDDSFSFSRLIKNKSKCNRNKRDIYINSIKDYLVERLLLDYYTKEFESKNKHLRETIFSHFFANSAGKMVEYLQKSIFDGCFILRMDIKNFFLSIPKVQLKDFIEEKFNNAEFLFNTLLKSIDRVDQYGNNIKGIAMGTPLSSFFSNIYLSQVDEYVLSLNSMYGSIKYTRYGDDMFFVLEKEDQINEIFNLVKEYCNKIFLDTYELFEKKASTVYKYENNKCFCRFNNYAFNENVISLKNSVFNSCKMRVSHFIGNIVKLNNEDVDSFIKKINNFLLNKNSKFKYSLLSELQHVTNYNQLLALDIFIRKMARRYFRNIDDKRILSIKNYIKNKYDIRSIEK